MSTNYFIRFYSKPDFVGEWVDRCLVQGTCEILDWPAQSAINQSAGPVSLYTGSNCDGEQILIGPEFASSKLPPILSFSLEPR